MFFLFCFFSENFQRRRRWKQSVLASHCIVEQKDLEDFKVVKINDYIGMRIKLQCPHPVGHPLCPLRRSLIRNLGVGWHE